MKVYLKWEKTKTVKPSNPAWIDRLSRAIIEHLDPLLIQSQAYPLLKSINLYALNGKGHINLDELHNGKDQRLSLTWSDKWGHQRRVSVTVQRGKLYVNGQNTYATPADMKYSLLEAFKRPEVVRGTSSKINIPDYILVFVLGVLSGALLASILFLILYGLP